MIRQTAAALLPIALLAGCAARTMQNGPAPSGGPVRDHPFATTTMPAPASSQTPGTVYIYRGMAADPSTGKIIWGAASFGISGGTLSFFAANDASRACWLKVKVDASDVPVPVGSGGTIALTLPAAGMQAPYAAVPWPATYDDAQTGHWSIAKATLGSSNSKAESNANLAFKNTADVDAATVSVVNGSLQNCQK